MPQDINSILVIIAFFIPGFITESIIGLTLTRREKSNTEFTILLISFSCFNYAIWAWLIYLMTLPDFHKTHYQYYWVFALVILFISPVIIGIVFTIGEKKNLIHKLLQFFSLSTKDPITRGWDYFFEKQKPVFVLITLKDKTKIGGLFGPDSFASFNPGEEDIYLEMLFELGENDEFLKPAQLSAGALIKREDILWMEFFEVRSKEKIYGSPQHQGAPEDFNQ